MSAYSRRPERGDRRHPRRRRRWILALTTTAALLLAMSVDRLALGAETAPRTGPLAGTGATTAKATTRAAVAADGTRTGQGTHFDSMGAPYGGCGIPQERLESAHFVALNVWNTPGDATPEPTPRPAPAGQSGRIGEWNNGHNCGRWVEVKIGDFCEGVNDGAIDRAFCQGGRWVTDRYNGATLNLLVADSCGDPNGWCRNDPHHLDLSTGSLNSFVKGGAPVADLYPAHWGNRKIEWRYVEAPGYSGDIRITFMKDAQPYWPALSVSRLPNGIHGVQYLSAGTWKDAPMNSDMGQSFIPQPTTPGGTTFTLRVVDAADRLLAGGRTYTFDLPAQCRAGCPTTAVEATYRTGTSTAS
ncbi:cellulose-binding protein [Streptomyces sp. NPDC058417]|uniref:cellulose-binding protein n=1 Tax=unclassified Streptomyces TaxID=2593676 RepID=UPI0036578A99